MKNLKKAIGGLISSPQSSDFFNPNSDSEFGQGGINPYIEGSNYPYNSPMNGSINEQQLYPLETNVNTNFLNSMSPNLYNKGGRVNYKDGGFASILGALGGHAIMPGLGGILGGGLGALLDDDKEAQDPRLAQLMAQLEEQGEDINPMSLAALLEQDEDMDDHEKLRRKMRKDSGTAYMQGGQVGNNPYAQSIQGNPQGEEEMDEEELMKLLAGAGSGNAPTFGRGGNVDIDELLEALGGRKKNMSFIDKLTSNSSDYFSDPGVLMGLAGTAARAFNKPKGRGASQVTKEPKQTPEERAMDIHRFNKAMRLSKNEMREEADYRKEADYMDWLARNNLNYGESLKESPLYVKRNDEEEAKKRGRWLEYYDNPNFTGNQLYMADGGLAQLLEQEYDPEKEENEEYREGEEYGFKDGGSLDIDNFLEHILEMLDGHVLDDEHHPSFMEYEDDEPDTTIIIKKKKIGPIKTVSERYIEGEDGGQDDTIPAKLSDGEYVMDASTVADIGDGNNRAGAKKLDKFRKKIRMQKRGGAIGLPPKSFSLEDYLNE